MKTKAIDQKRHLTKRINKNNCPAQQTVISINLIPHSLSQTPSHSFTPLITVSDKTKTRPFQDDFKDVDEYLITNRNEQITYSDQEEGEENSMMDESCFISSKKRDPEYSLSSNVPKKNKKIQYSFKACEQLPYQRSETDRMILCMVGKLGTKTYQRKQRHKYNIVKLNENCFVDPYFNKVQVRLYDKENLDIIKNISIPESVGTNSAMAPIPGLSKMLLSTNDNKLCIVDFNTSRITPLNTVPPALTLSQCSPLTPSQCFPVVKSMVFANLRTFVGCTDRNTLQVYKLSQNIADNNVQHMATENLRKSVEVNSIHAMFMQEDRMIVSESGHTLKLYDFPTMTSLTTMHARAATYCMHRLDNNVFLSGGGYDAVELRDIRLGRVVSKIETLDKWTGFVTETHGNVIYSDWKSLVIFDLRARREVMRQKEYHKSGIWEGLLMGNGKALVSSSSDGIVNAFNLGFMQGQQRQETPAII